MFLWHFRLSWTCPFAWKLISCFKSNFSNVQKDERPCLTTPPNTVMRIKTVRLAAEYLWRTCWVCGALFTVYTNPSQKRSFSKTLFKCQEFSWKRPLCILVWTENIWKRSFSKRWNYDNHVTSIPRPCFPQTQTQNDRWSLRFQISTA